MITNTSSLTTKLNSIISNSSSILTKLDEILSAIGTARGATLLSKLSDINSNVLNFKILFDSFNNSFLEFKNTFDNFISDYYPPEQVYQPIYLGWDNFWSSFELVTLHDFIINIYDEIDSKVNPLSSNNQAAFNTSVNNLKQNTFVGSLLSVQSQGSQIVTQMGNIEPNSHIYVNTLSTSFFGINIPSKTIDIDMSWYAAYRVQCFSIMRAFILISYFILLIRAAPSILGGASPIFDSPSTFESIDINEDGVVTSHTTTYKDGNVSIRQHH